jgi:protein-L-isoaspartate(D-aspartate) O-methyltransferase
MNEAANSGEGSTTAYQRLRLEMVRSQIAARGVSSELVLAAMREVPRHEFVPARLRDHAYEDRPLPIGFSQTISQPYIVAAMTELAELREGSRVLEIGTGSGYQAAVIHEIVGEVYSIEIIEELAQLAEQTLRQLGYDSAHLRHGDGYRGWPEEAPFDAILVTAAPPEVPRALLEQLAVGGHLVVPVGEFFQQLERHTRTPEGIEKEVIFGVRFVPMVHGK